MNRGLIPTHAKHYYRWLTSKDYRLHYWLKRNLRKHRAAWQFMPFVLSLLDTEVLKDLLCVTKGKRGIRMRKVLDEVIKLKEDKNVKGTNT